MLTETLIGPPPEAPPAWDGEADDRLVCAAVRPETHDVKTFVFRAPDARRFRFRPGQFLTFAFAIDGAVVNRCYTIASPPTRPDRVAITVKRVPGGLVSNRLHDTLRPGAVVRAVGPLGVFTLPERKRDKLLFLSGGSGVTPVMAMTRALHDLADDRDVVFVHAARTPGDIVFRRELEVIAGHLPRLRVAHVVEDTAGEPSWSGHRGRLTRPLLELLAPDLAERTVFCCGPAPFMAAVRAILAETGFDLGRYHEESFAFEDQAPPIQAAAPEETAPAEEAATQSFTVRFAKSGRSVPCAADQTILDAARKAGLRLPSSCTRGLCGTCKSRMTEGAVDMRHGGGIRQREIDQGHVLICCSRPLGDVVIDR